MKGTPCVALRKVRGQKELVKSEKALIASQSVVVVGLVEIEE